MPGNRKIFYYCYDHQRPTGGQKSVYRHVDVLNKHGYNATILHKADGFRLSWFPNNTPVVSFEQFTAKFDKQRDYVVLPEDLGEEIVTFPGNKVIINQNVFYGFRCFGFNEVANDPYLHKNVKFVLVKSEHNKEYLKFVYPSCSIIRVLNGIDPAVFKFSAIDRKKKMIACVSNKNQTDVLQVCNILAARARQNLNQLSQYKWISIEGMGQDQVGKVLGQSLIVVFLSRHDGFARIPLEAMLSGAVVVANNVPPLNEYLNQDNAFLSSPGDVLNTVKDIEQITHWFENHPKKLEQVIQRAYRTAQFYSPAREEDSIISAWKTLLHGTGKSKNRESKEEKECLFF